MCLTPASHSFSLKLTREEPCGQAQVYPPGRRRHRWLHTSLQGFTTETKELLWLLYETLVQLVFMDYNIPAEITGWEIASHLNGCICAHDRCGPESARDLWSTPSPCPPSQTCQLSTLHPWPLLSSTHGLQTHPDCRGFQYLQTRPFCSTLKQKSLRKLYLKYIGINFTLNIRIVYVGQAKTVNRTVYVYNINIKFAYVLVWCPTSWHDNLPLCSIWLHWLNNVLFGVTPVNPVSIKVI